MRVKLIKVFNMFKNLKQKIQEKDANICVVGLGYVGLPTAIFFAEKGFNTIGVDLEEKKIAKINRGISPIDELNLESRLFKVVKAGKLMATLDLEDATRKSDIILIIVPTPVTKI